MNSKKKVRGKEKIVFKSGFSATIWMLKILFFLNILVGLMGLVYDKTNWWKYLISIAISTAMLVGLYKRLKWAWYLGIAVFLFAAVYALVMTFKDWTFLLYMISVIVLCGMFIWQKDYFNK